MTLTTALSPPVGINWQAVITAYLSLLTEPGIGITDTPNVGINLSALPKIGLQPPVDLALFTTPTIGAVGGSKENSSLKIALSPSIGVGTNPNAILNLSTTPTIGATGTPIDSGTLGLTLTPTIGLSATGITAVTYDSTGGGSAVIATSTSWTHTIAGNCLIAHVAAQNTGSITGSQVDAKIGTTSLTRLGSSNPFNDSGYEVVSVIFGMLNPPTGSQTISISVTGGNTLQGNSISYNNVGSLGTVIAGIGSSSAPALSVSSARGQMVSENFVTWSTAPSGYTQTSRYTETTVRPMLVGDAPGASTVNFSAASCDFWAASAIPLIPA